MKKMLYQVTVVLFAGILISGRGIVYRTKKNSNAATDTAYACLPCGSDCDTRTFSKPGICSHCSMQLVDRKTIVHKNIQPDQMCSLIEKNVLFLDVRTPAEFNGTAEEKFGAIKNAINIPVQQLEARMNELEKYRGKQIVVYCSHSHRSPGASYMLTQNGYKQVINMQGGMSVWKESVKNKACNSKLYIEH